MLRVCLFFLSALLACACAYKDMSAVAQALESGVHQHPKRHSRDLPMSFLIPGGEGEGPWAEWGEVSPCSRTCGGGVASQKRICLQPGPEGQSPCTGGDTKYFSCQTQDCPDGSGDFRAEQCAEFNDKAFRGLKVNWVPYTKAPNTCELNCRPHGERFYYRHKLHVTDGTRCDDVSYDVCVNGKCQPVGCDMMLNSTAQEDKCRQCRGNGTNCRTTEGIFDSQDLLKGYNDILLIPSGSTSIKIEEIKPSYNYLALRAKNGSYYLNSHYHIDFPRSIIIAGALWTYERNQVGFTAPDKLRCLGPTTEPLYLSLLLQEENVGIKYEYSTPGKPAAPQNVTEGTLEEKKTMVEVVPMPMVDVSRDMVGFHWVEGPWGECSQRCGSGGVRSREVTCQEIIYNSKVPDKSCFDFLGPKPELFQKCNEDAPCPTWSVGNWTACDKLCDEGKQTRHVVCFQKKNSFFEMLDDEVCTEKKPEEEQPCILKLCDRGDWFTSGWSGCDSCTSKFYTRTVVCSTKSQTGLNESFCSNLSRPVDHEECNKDELPPCEVQWYAMQWSKCSVTCGEGVQIRKVFCGYDNVSGEGVQVVEDSMCDILTKYNDTRPCTVPKEECPSQWFAGPWSECTEECGGGKQYRRVMCFRGDKVDSDCDVSTVFDSVQVCNSGSCMQDPVRVPVGITGDENAVVTGELGQSLHVRCLAYGYPPPAVFWYRSHKGTNLLYNDTVYKVTGNTLIIRTLAIEALGQYTCKAYNGDGKAASWSVMVRAYKPEGLFIVNEFLVPRNTSEPRPRTQPPTTAEKSTTTENTTTTSSITTEAPRPLFTVPVSTHVSTPFSTLSIGADLRLTCEVEGFPEPDVHWTKDGANIQTDSRIIITGNAIMSRLTVTQVSVVDSGLYACHASNPYNSQSDTAQIKVQQLMIPANCTDYLVFANCNLIVRSKFCSQKYYAKFCCKSCVESGQVDPQEFKLQEDQSRKIK